MTEGTSSQAKAVGGACFSVDGIRNYQCF